MNKWLVIHSKESYIQHNNLIGCKLINHHKRKIPKKSIFQDIKKGDMVVYYAIGKEIIGAFKIISDIDYLTDDPYWGEMATYRIKPILTPSKTLLITDLIKNPKTKFDLFKKKEYWGSYLQGKLVKKLSENDFNLFYEFIRKNS